jgi:hypothetical protein
MMFMVSELFDPSPYQEPPLPPTRLQQERAKWGGRSPVCTSEWQRYRCRVLPIVLDRQGGLCALCRYPIDPELPGNHAQGVAPPGCTVQVLGTLTDIWSA